MGASAAATCDTKWSTARGEWSTDLGILVADGQCGLDARQLRASKQLSRPGHKDQSEWIGSGGWEATGMGMQKLKLHPRARWTNTKWYRVRF